MCYVNQDTWLCQEWRRLCHVQDLGTQGVLTGGTPTGRQAPGLLSISVTFDLQTHFPTRLRGLVGVGGPVPDKLASLPDATMTRLRQVLIWPGEHKSQEGRICKTKQDSVCTVPLV